MKRSLALAAVAACLMSGSAFAQDLLKLEEVVDVEDGPSGGFITDGVNRFEINSYSVSTGASTDYEVPTGTDHQFSMWWWYRVAGDTEETVMPPPDTESFVGDTAILTWSDIDGRGLFSAEAMYVILAEGGGSSLLADLTVTDLGGADLDLQIFNYVDMDMDASAADDSAIEISPTLMEISQTAVALYAVYNADAYMVATFPEVRNLLTDGNVDDFASTGLPFGPGDFTGAYQEGKVVLAGDSYAFISDLCINSEEGCLLDPGLIFEDGFESGDTSAWSNTVP